MQKRPFHILPIIVFAQFAGTSLWFAGNAVARDLWTALNLTVGSVGDITSAVQLGFIAGTLVFAVLSIADRFSPTRVFLFSALAGALFNVSVIWLAKDLFSLLSLRFLTGFFLAGIYPVGMKISADWYEKGLGKALGYLVGALVFGTAFPHFLKAFSGGLAWENILTTTSILATLGGVLIYFLVGDGPYRKAAPKFEWGAIPKIFSYKKFRAAAFGYFGHMWELYAMWTFVPILLNDFFIRNHIIAPVSLWSFIIIGMGGFGCIMGGYISLKKGSAKVASGMLLASGIICLISPYLFVLPTNLFLLVLIIWGFSVVGDSPQFSTIVAQTAPKEYIGTALTIVNCIGFALTIFSIQLLVFLQNKIGVHLYYLFLLPGPIFGLWSMRTFFRK
ncbi:MAG: MFS transporter [Bacteroidota bacterium]